MARGLSCVVALALLGIGCSGGGAKSDGQGDLLDRIPADSRFVSVVDLVEAREALDLGDKAGLETVKDKTVGLSFVFAAAQGLPHLQNPNFDADPIADALDIGQVQGAATGGYGLKDVTVVRTTQPVDEVLDRMVEGAYEPKGDAVVHVRGASQVLGVTYGAAREAGGLLVLARDEDSLEAALEENPSADKPWRNLIDGVDGAVRVLLYPGGGRCLTGIAGSDSIEPREGEFLLEPSGEPDTGRLGFIGGERSGPNPFGGIDFGDAEESGNFLRVPFDYGSRPAISPALSLRGDLPVSTYYDCG